MRIRKSFVGAAVLGACTAIAVPAWAWISLSSNTGSGGYTADSVGTPTVQLVTTYNGASTLYWNPPSTPSGASFTYTVVRVSGGGTIAGTCAGTLTSTSCTDTGLTLGTTYNYSVTATISGTSWASSTAGTGSVTAAGAISKFVVSVTPTSVTAGGTVSPTVTAEDSAGRQLTGYGGTVHFSSTDSQAGLPSNYTFTSAPSGADNGAHTFTSGVTFKTAGTQTISVKDTVTTSATGTSPNVTVTASTPSTMATVQGSPQTTWINTAFITGLKVQVKDQFGNLVSGASVTFTATGTQASGTFANGTATTSATTDSSGDATASTFTANGTTGSFSVTTSVTGVTSPPTFSLTNIGSLTIGSVVRDGGNKKVHFTGTNGISGQAITLYICTGTVTSCPSTSAVATSVVASSSAGASWTSAQDSNNLYNGSVTSSGAYTAQAVSGSETSAVFDFNTTGL